MRELREKLRRQAVGGLGRDRTRVHPALDYRGMEVGPRGLLDKVRQDRVTASRLAENRHASSVAAERADMLLDPSHREPLVLDSQTASGEVSRRVVDGEES